MPNRQVPPRELLESFLHRNRDDTSDVQRQQNTVIVDPTGATGDPANGFAVAVIGDLDPIAGIAAFGIAVWTGSAWVQLPSGGAFRFSQTYAWTGPVVVTSSAFGYFPPTYIPVIGGGSVSLVEVRYSVRAGTSATFTVNHNGSAISGMTGLSATPTPATTAHTTAITDLDAISIDVTAISGAPDGLSVSLVFEVS